MAGRQASTQLWAQLRRLQLSNLQHAKYGTSAFVDRGNIVEWKKKEGDEIVAGDILAEMETDKATIDWDSQEEGFLAKILKGDGSKDIPVGTPVAILVDEQKHVAAFKNYSGGGGGGGGSSSGKEEAPAKDEEAPAKEAAPKKEPAKEDKKAKAPPKKAAKPSGRTFPSHQVLTMPNLSPSMSTGNIVSWQKKVGDAIAAGDIMCDVETDKSTMAWESQEEGYLAVILAGDGTKDIPLGTPVAVLVEEKDDVAAFKDYTAADAQGGGGAAAAEEPAGSEEPELEAPRDADVSKDQQQAQPAPKKPAPSTSSSGDRIIASPYAKKLAADAGVSLEGVSGSGPNGRIVAEDVQKLISSGKGKAPSAAAASRPSGAAAAAAPSTAGTDYTDVPVSQIKKITAQRLLESKQTIPHYYLTMELQVDALLKLRAHINESLAASGTKLSVNDFIVKAAALALRKAPAVNASWNTDFIRQYHNVDINVAVQTPVGLMVPFVRDADKKGLQAISTEVKQLAGKAKEGKLQPSQFQGGTFTISNLGMYGIKQFAAIVNPPQAAILAVGASEKKVVVHKDGSYGEATAMLVTLSCDHRVVDGAVGAEWLNAFKGYMENPLTMMI